MTADPLLSIALVDDKSYGLQQIQNAIPASAELEWFSSANDFLASGKTFDFVFLDYYLDEDGITGDTIVSAVQQYAKEIIAFSSVPSGNKKILLAGAQRSFLKLLGDNNDALHTFFLTFLVERRSVD
ncbi:hypothetical protein IPN35_05025 [Candidatus Peregrinibacteria bacterium]|nr:MAG: hypothetical protein IPN35_05025 [Candidatus Peregrinibacteria bacterium]